MIFITNTKVALDSLKATRGRTYLTMLGIIIGVASISLILTLGESIKHALNQQVSSLGKNIVVVRPGKANNGILDGKSFFNYSPLAGYATTTITEQDLTRLAARPNISSAAPLMLINGNVSVKKQVADYAPILATSSGFAPIMGLETTQGQFIDETVDRDTVVIGNQLAIDLFGSDQSVGQQLDIRGRAHTVIGVLKKNKGPIGINGIDINRAAVISLEDGKSFNQGIAQIQQINLTLKKGSDRTAVIKDLSNTLKQSHTGQEDYNVVAGEDAAAVSKSFYDTITTLTAVVASIALIVGGVGIMNIMLVGVAERTKEIGIRKSLGASNNHIMWQFLIEALMMSVTGGIIGIILAYLLAAFIGLLLGFLPVIAWQVMLVAFALSVAVGVIFGLTPAMRAARKDPIEALRDQG